MIEDKIKKVIEEKVNPLLESHYGGAILTGYENKIAKIKLTGACSSCPSAQYTIEDVVKEILTAEIPEIEDVVLDMSVSQDLIDMAKKLLNHER